MAKQKKKSNWGGVRPGSGRPNYLGESQQFALRVPVELLDQLEDLAKQAELSRSEYVRDVLERHVKRAR